MFTPNGFCQTRVTLDKEYIKIYEDGITLYPFCVFVSRDSDLVVYLVKIWYKLENGKLHIYRKPPTRDVTHPNYWARAHAPKKEIYITSAIIKAKKLLLTNKTSIISQGENK